jgi:1-deoxy-D-xylulose-5-phosphate synthase
MTPLLDKINCPQDLHLLSLDELQTLAEEIREYITHSVSQTGGHLASNLGIVETTIAMHYVFDFKKDRLLWDVGHQSYAHKILTGRKDLATKLRQPNGISGFPDPEESPYDLFKVGHAGTSIATALGMALGAQLNKTEEKIVALIGDASIVNGTSFEALNNLGLVKRQMLIVLNDNSMAIDITQGAIAKFLAKVRLSHTYEDLRKTTDNILEHLPVIGKKMEGALRSFKKTLRMAISPSRLFESLNVPYFGPVDGHDIGSLIELFKAMAELDRPAILHIYTKKGKGFTPADNDPRKFHSTGPFKINGQQPKTEKTFTNAFGDILVELGKNDERIIAITAAMPDGTGLVKFRDRFGERYYDVGIAESAAVDIAAGLAKQGKRPIVCIYSTFLQRGFDHIFQEVALQNLPVIFCIDRAGLVGSDGPTHHGMMDIGFLRMIPNMVLISPASQAELKAALTFALAGESPVAIRYPKDTLPNSEIENATAKIPFESAKSLTIKHGTAPVAIVALGPILAQALKAAKQLSAEGIEPTVINARFAKPIDKKIIDLLSENISIITLEDHRLACGFGAAVLELDAMQNTGNNAPKQARIITLGAKDAFIKADRRSVQLDEIAITEQRIVETVKNVINRY